MDNLRSTRLIAAWLIVAFVGLSELNALVEWITWLDKVSPLTALSRSYLPNGLIVFLPVIAVILTGLIQPRTPAARPLAMVAYVQYAFMLIWNAMFFVDQVVSRMSPQPEEYGGPGLQANVGILISLAGLALLAAIGALVSWQVYRALDPLAAEIVELEEQIDELREADDEATSGA
jgi:hypothetical protein